MHFLQNVLESLPYGFNSHGKSLEILAKGKEWGKGWGVTGIKETIIRT